MAWEMRGRRPISIWARALLSDGIAGEALSNPASTHLINSTTAYLAWRCVGGEKGRGGKVWEEERSRAFYVPSWNLADTRIFRVSLRLVIKNPIPNTHETLFVSQSKHARFWLHSVQHARTYLHLKKQTYHMHVRTDCEMLSVRKKAAQVGIVSWLCCCDGIVCLLYQYVRTYRYIIALNWTLYHMYVRTHQKSRRKTRSIPFKFFRATVPLLQTRAQKKNKPNYHYLLLFIVFWIQTKLTQKKIT